MESTVRATVIEASTNKKPIGWRRRKITTVAETRRQRQIEKKLTSALPSHSAIAAAAADACFNCLCRLWKNRHLAIYDGAAVSATGDARTEGSDAVEYPDGSRLINETGTWPRRLRRVSSVARSVCGARWLWVLVTGTNGVVTRERI